MKTLTIITLAAALAAPIVTVDAADDKDVVAAVAKEQTVVGKIKVLLKERLGAQPNGAKLVITDTSLFKKDLKMDSLDIAELVMDTEDLMQVRIPDSFFDKISDMSVKEYSDKVSNLPKVKK